MKKHSLIIFSCLAILAVSINASALSFKCVGYPPESKTSEEMWSHETKITAEFQWSSRAEDRLINMDLRFGKTASFHSPAVFEDTKHWEQINPERYDVFTVMTSVGTGGNISFAVRKSLGHTFKFRSYILTDKYDGPQKIALECKRSW